MILQYRSHAYYRDLQGRYYRAALGLPDEIVPYGQDVSSDEECPFCIDLPVERYTDLWDILEGDDRVLKEKKRIREFRDRDYPKTQPQPLVRKLP